VTQKALQGSDPCACLPRRSRARRDTFVLHLCRAGVDMTELRIKQALDIRIVFCVDSRIKDP